MKFEIKEIKTVDFATLEVGTVANATFKSFNYQSDYCFGTFVADGESVRAIIGTKADCPIKDMLPLKGIQVEVTFAGTKVSNGVSYPSYYISF